MAWQVSSIITYPIKGLVGQTHQAITAPAGGLLPGDRAYGLTSGTAQSLSAATDSWLKKAHFLQMMNIAALASLSLRFDEASARLTLHASETSDLAEPLFDGILSNEADGLRLCEMMADFLQLPADSPRPRLFHLNEGGLTDTKTPYVAFGNTASITDFAHKAGIDDDSRRYRLNVMMTGAPAFAENDLLGLKARLGTAEFAFIERVGRCAAIEVDPKDATRKKGLVQEMQQAYGAADMGIFATITKSGSFAIGDSLTIL